MSVVLHFPTATDHLSRPPGGEPGRGNRRAILRRLIEEDIGRLITILVKLDGDPDAAEDDTSEPSLGWSGSMAHSETDDAEQGKVPP